MEILLNPNVAYIFLAGGVLLALLAVMAPGSGILEISALIGLVLAGYAALNLPINYWALGVLFLGVMFFVLSLRAARSLMLLAISIAFLVIGSAFLFGTDEWYKPAVNPFLALVVSGLMAGFFWVAARKYLEAKSELPAHDLQALIGLIGETKSAVFTDGSVQVAGELWSARSRVPIEASTEIRVIDREGFMLIVEAVDKGQPGISQ